MEAREKNPVLKDLILEADEKGRHENGGFWKNLAKKMNRPRRKSYEVNLFRLERHASGKGTIIVPGLVLGSGNITKPVTVAALRFSRIAEEKIKKAGGKTMTIREFIDTGKTKGVSVMG